MDRVVECKPGLTRRRGVPGTVGRLIAVLVAMALLAACQTGGMTYNSDTGLFSMPFGADSHKNGS